NKIGGRSGFAAVGGFDRDGKHPVQARPGGVEEKILPPFVEDDTPRIRDRELGGAFELPTLRAETVKTAIDTAHRTVGRFNTAVQENPLTHDKGSRGIGGKGADG